MGYLWNKKLMEKLPIPHRHLRSTARELGVDPGTILRYVEIIAQDNVKTGQEFETRATDPCPRRKQWLDLVEQNPDLGIKALRELSPATFTWLYRHDRDWLDNHKPSPKKGDNRSELRVDWGQRDREISDQIPAAVERIKSRSGKPIQVTKAAIGRELGMLSLLEKHMDKLPLCSSAIAELVEDRAMYALRRIDRVVKVYGALSISLPRWQLVRKAGIGRIQNRPEIQIALDRSFSAFDDGDDSAYI
jgi:hypothetical protein